MRGADFKDYLLEYQAEGIGTLLYALIVSVVKQITVRYPPTIYSPNQVWDDDAVAAVAHDFTMEKLLRRGWLEHHLLTQETTVGLRWVLARDVRQFLINHRKRSEYSNIFQRVQQILHTDERFDDCQNLKHKRTRLWCLAAGKQSGEVQELDVVLEAMFAFKLPDLVRYRASSTKQSHLLSNDDLTALLVHTFQAVGKCIDIALLMMGLRYRLNLMESDTISLDTMHGEAADEISPTLATSIPASSDVESTLSLQEIASDIFETLSERQRTILSLRLSLPDPTLETISMRVGTSKSTVHNEMRTIADRIASADLDQEEVTTLLTYLTHLCQQYQADT